MPERLLALTFALEDAVRRRDWKEVHVLFRERGEILESDLSIPAKYYEALHQADARLMSRLESQRSELVKSLRHQRKASLAAKTYSRVGQAA